jgi:hypothetical protein
MPISNITISQDNKVNGSNLEPIHSTLVFIAEVTYSGSVPDVLHVEIRDDADLLLETYKAIPYRDPTITTRLFVFIANDPVKSIMEGFDDFFQLTETFLFVENITKILKIRFVDPDNAATFEEVEIDFVHGAAQFGENPNLDEQFNNESQIYFAPIGGIVYVYFYNDDPANDVAIDGPVLTEGNALDFDDAIFTDFDDSDFTIFTLV